jgi:iron(III) transport system permease protein
VKATRIALLTAIAVFLILFLFYPLAYSCKSAFFDGSWRLRRDEVLDWRALAASIAGEPRTGPSAQVWAVIPEDAQAALSQCASGKALTDEQRKTVLDSINTQVIPSDKYYSPDAFRGVQVSESGHSLERHYAWARAAAEVGALTGKMTAPLLAAKDTRMDVAPLLTDAGKADASLDRLVKLTGEPAGVNAVRQAVAAVRTRLETAGSVAPDDLIALGEALQQASNGLVSRYRFSPEDLEHLNRRLLEAAFPTALARIHFAGGHLTAEFFKYFWTDALTRQSILNSLALGIIVTVLAAMLALPLSMLMVRYRFPGKALLGGLILLPMIMPPFVGAIGMRQIFARFGSLNLLLMQAGLMHTPIDWLGSQRFWGVAIMEVLGLYPIMYLNFAAALANVDPSLEEAAVNMGSSGLRLFRRITLPLMMPGLFAGSVLVFIWAFTDLGTPLVFGFRQVVPVQIFNQVSEITTNPKGYALVVGVLALTVLIFLTAKQFFGTRAYQSLSRGRTGAGERQAGPVAGALMTAFILCVVLVAILPHVAVVLTALKARWFMTVLPDQYTLAHFRDALGHRLTLGGIRNSIAYSALSTVADLVLGIVIAYLLVRHKFRGANLLDALVMLPLAIPGLVLAFGYVAAFSSLPVTPDQGFLVKVARGARNALDPRINPVPLLVIAYAIRRLPYMVRAAYAGFQQVNVELEEAAVNMGSPPLRAMRKITVPLVSANLIAGGILAFSFAMLEVSDSLILAMQEKFYPITKAIYQLINRIADGPYIASALGVWAMVFLGLSLITAGVLLGRRMGQLFRA